MHFLFYCMLCVLSPATFLYGSLSTGEHQEPQTSIYLPAKGIQAITIEITPEFLEIITLHETPNQEGHKSTLETEVVSKKLSLPKDEIKYITKLLLPRNSLRTIPLAILLLRNLKHLHLNTNQLEVLPSLAALPYLQSLDVSFNRLKELPLLPASMTWLHASHNAITNWPPIEHMNQLKELDLSHNQIQHFGDLAHHPDLICLNISYNPSPTLPSFSALSQICTLDVTDCGTCDSKGLGTLVTFLETVHTKHIHLGMSHQQHQALIPLLSLKARADLHSPQRYSIKTIKQ